MEMELKSIYIEELGEHRDNHSPLRRQLQMNISDSTHTHTHTHTLAPYFHLRVCETDRNLASLFLL